MKIKYVITAIMDEEIENWEGAKTEEDVLRLVTEYVKEDPDYIFGGLDHFTIESSIVE